MRRWTLADEKAVNDVIQATQIEALLQQTVNRCPADNANASGLQWC
jgi:hypothetical protein